MHFDIDDLDELDAVVLTPGSPNAQEYDEEFGPGIGRDIVKLAEARGCEPVLPADEYELLLDLDTPEARALLDLQLERFNQCEAQFRGEGLARIAEEWTSRSGVGKHVIVRMPFGMRDESERVLYQALFGSDIKRELYNVMRVLKDLPNPNTLFRPKSAVVARADEPPF